MIALLRCSLLKMCVRLVLNTVPLQLCQPGVAITCRLIRAEYVKIEFSSVRQAALNIVMVNFIHPQRLEKVTINEEQDYLILLKSSCIDLRLFEFNSRFI